jgi:fibro-slime domain-containing protein
MSYKAVVFAGALLSMAGCAGGDGSDDGRSPSGGNQNHGTGGNFPDGGIIIDVPPSGNSGECAPKIIGLLRDFQSYRSSKTTITIDALQTCPVYADFQGPWEGPVPDLGFPEQGIVQSTLGADRKPVFSGGNFKTITSADTFNAWYRDDPECTKTFEYEVPMVEDPESGNLVFSSNRFFPLDGRGFGTSGRDDFPEDGQNDHNFHFTFELHMTLQYRPGDVFNFSGDDDLWVFINNQLVIDLGGAHAAMSASVALDSLGLEPGREYPIDFFHAERSEAQSNFHIETSLQFTNCDPIIVR